MTELENESFTKEDFDKYFELKDQLNFFLEKEYYKYRELFINNKKKHFSVKEITEGHILFSEFNYYGHEDEGNEIQVDTRFFFDLEFRQKMIKDKEKRDFECEQLKIKRIEEEKLLKEQEEFNLFNKLKEKYEKNSNNC